MQAQRRVGLAVVLALVAGIVAWGVTLRPADGVGRTEVAHPVRVPLEVEHARADTAVVIPVRIAGRGPYWFALDTGASTSAVSEELVEELHLEDTGATGDFATANGSTRSHLYRVPAWSIGTLPLQRHAVVARLTSPDVDGLLGADQLSRFGAVTVDFTREELRIAPSPTS